LGVGVDNDAEGVMQDTHWASGLYGYFPTYALGNIYTGQIAEAMSKSGDWRGKIAGGDLSDVRQWLAAKIYCPANLYDPTDLIKRATGQALTVKPYIQYLNEKFSRLYGF
jgi:carboxypeptidase Taq